MEGPCLRVVDLGDRLSRHRVFEHGGCTGDFTQRQRKGSFLLAIAYSA